MVGAVLAGPTFGAKTLLLSKIILFFKILDFYGSFRFIFVFIKTFKKFTKLYLSDPKFSRGMPLAPHV